MILLIIAILPLSLFAQNNCGTIVTPTQLNYLNQTRAQRQNFNLNGQRGVLIQIPTQHHVVRRSDGTGGFSSSSVTNVMTELNAYYFNSNLEFYQCSAINYIDDDVYYNFNTSMGSSFRSTYAVPNVLNIYYFNSISNSSGSYCGIAYFPPSNNGVMIANSCAINGSTMIHEVGHYFSLYHTHGKGNCSTTDELVNGSNCVDHGDDVCDTPADPNLLNYFNNCGSYLVDGNCNYTGTHTDANGDSFNPQTNNIMSYSRKSCRNFLSSGQYNRVAYSAQYDRGYLTCSQPPCIPPTLTLNSTDVDCYGNNNGTATASVSGGTPPYTYNWSTGSTGSSLANLSTGTYNITVIGSDLCFTVGSVTISGLAPDVSCPADITDTADINCQYIVGDFTTSSVTSCPGNNISQYPTPGTIVGLGNTPIIITVTDSSGASSNCTFILTVEVGQPSSIVCPVDTSVDADGNCQYILSDYTATSVISGCGSSNINQVPAPGATIGLGNTVVTLTSCNQILIDNNDFEIGWGLWNDGGKDCRRHIQDAPYAYSGSYCVRLRDNSSSSVITTNSLDLSVYDELTVDFNYYTLDMDNANEGFVLQISSNGGTTYQTVEEWNLNNEFTNGNRFFDQVLISGPFTPNTKLRFSCVASNKNDWVYIDDIEIQGCVRLAQCDFIVIVEDNEGPTIICPTDITEYANADCLFELPDFTEDVIVISDNCQDISVSQFLLPGTIVGLGNTPILLTAIDVSGNVGNCSFKLTLNNCATCTDSIQNGDETGIDCGGVTCAPCELSCAYSLIDSNNFESGWGIWNDGGANCRRHVNDAPYANSGLYCVRLRDNSSSSVITTDILDLSVYNELTIDFSYYPIGMDNSTEGFLFQLSLDGGVTYTTIEEWNLNDEFTNGQHYFDQVLVSGPFTANTLLRFRCDASDKRDWIYIDDVVVSGCSTIQLLVENENTTQRNVDSLLGVIEPKEDEPFLKVYPNPFSDRAIIEFSSPIKTNMLLEVYNLQGEKITTLFDGVIQQSEIIKTEFYSGSFSNGLYIAKLETPYKTFYMKMLLMK